MDSIFEVEVHNVRTALVELQDALDDATGADTLSKAEVERLRSDAEQIIHLCDMYGED